MVDVPLPRLTYTVSKHFVLEKGSMIPARVPVVTVNRVPVRSELEDILASTKKSDSPVVKWGTWGQNYPGTDEYFFASDVTSGVSRTARSLFGKPHDNPLDESGLEWGLHARQIHYGMVLLKIPEATSTLTAHTEYEELAEWREYQSHETAEEEKLSWRWLRWASIPLLYLLGIVLIAFGFILLGVLAGAGGLIALATGCFSEKRVAVEEPEHRPEYVSVRWEQFTAVAELATLTLLPSTQKTVTATSREQELVAEVARTRKLLDVLHVSGISGNSPLRAELLGKDPDYPTIASPQ